MGKNRETKVERISGGWGLPLCGARIYNTIHHQPRVPTRPDHPGLCPFYFISTSAPVSPSASVRELYEKDPKRSGDPPTPTSAHRRHSARSQPDPRHPRAPSPSYRRLRSLKIVWTSFRSPTPRHATPHHTPPHATSTTADETRTALRLDLEACHLWEVRSGREVEDVHVVKDGPSIVPSEYEQPRVGKERDMIPARLEGAPERASRLILQGHYEVRGEQGA